MSSDLKRFPVGTIVLGHKVVRHGRPTEGIRFVHASRMAYGQPAITLARETFHHDEAIVEPATVAEVLDALRNELIRQRQAHYDRHDRLRAERLKDIPEEQRAGIDSDSMETLKLGMAQGLDQAIAALKQQGLE